MILVAGGVEQQCQTITEVAAANNLTKLAITTLSLADDPDVGKELALALSNDAVAKDKMTMFMPTNDAFRDIPQEALTVRNIKPILFNSIVLRDIDTKQMLSMLEGKPAGVIVTSMVGPLTFSLADDGQLQVISPSMPKPARFIKSDIRTCIGLAHIVDGLLLTDVRESELPDAPQLTSALAGNFSSNVSVTPATSGASQRPAADVAEADSAPAPGPAADANGSRQAASSEVAPPRRQGGEAMGVAAFSDGESGESGAGGGGGEKKFLVKGIGIGVAVTALMAILTTIAVIRRNRRNAARTEELKVNGGYKNVKGVMLQTPTPQSRARHASFHSHASHSCSMPLPDSTSKLSQQLPQEAGDRSFQQSQRLNLKALAVPWAPSVWRKHPKAPVAPPPPRCTHVKGDPNSPLVGRMITCTTMPENHPLLARYGGGGLYNSGGVYSSGGLDTARSGDTTSGGYQGEQTPPRHPLVGIPGGVPMLQSSSGVLDGPYGGGGGALSLGTGGVPRPLSEPSPAGTSAEGLEIQRIVQKAEDVAAVPAAGAAHPQPHAQRRAARRGKHGRGPFLVPPHNPTPPSPEARSGPLGNTSGFSLPGPPSLTHALLPSASHMHGTVTTTTTASFHDPAGLSTPPNAQQNPIFEAVNDGAAASGEESSRGAFEADSSSQLLLGIPVRSPELSCTPSIRMRSYTPRGKEQEQSTAGATDSSLRRPLHAASSQDTGSHMSSMARPAQPDGTADLREWEEYLDYQLDTLSGRTFLGHMEMITGPGMRLHGGQATVQMCVDTRTSREYAIKFFLSPHSYMQEASLYADANKPLGRFLPEVHRMVNDPRDKASQRLRDAHGAALPPCIVMEKGESLDMWVVRGGEGMDIVTGLQVLTHVAERLTDLHECGYVHRDIKPGNIMWLPRKNRWTIIDFGCAARVGTLAPQGFSFAYAAPEAIKDFQDDKELVEVTEGVDVWSVGILAIEMFTGQPPFSLMQSQEETMDMILGVATAPWEDEQTAPLILRRLGHLREVVLAALSRSPEARPRMKDFLRACRNVLSRTGDREDR